MSTYTIQRGDTLSGIAKRNNTDVNTLMGLNPYITNANKIYAGKSLTLPDAQPTAQPTQPTQPTVQPSTATTQTTNTPVSQALNPGLGKQVNNDFQSSISKINTAMNPIAAQIKNNSTPVKTTQELADEYARGGISEAGKSVIDPYNRVIERQKQALAGQRQLAENQINAQRDEVMQAYNNNARQAYINSMLGKKQVEQQLAQAGLNTSGLVGSAYANVENAYGNNLANLQTARDNSINNINRQLNDAKLQYDIEENRLLAEIEQARIEYQKYQDQFAWQKYQDKINNYLNFENIDYKKFIDNRDYNYQLERDKVTDDQWQKKYDYDKLIDDRNYNYQLNRDAIEDRQWQQKYDSDKEIADRNYNYQVGRDNVEDDKWKKEYELALKKAKSSGSSSGSSRSSSGGSSSGSKTGNYSIPDNSTTGYELTELRDNVLAIKNPNGEYSTLTIFPGVTREQILTWGRNSGMDLSGYDLSKYLK